MTRSALLLALLALCVATTTAQRVGVVPPSCSAGSSDADELHALQAVDRRLAVLDFDTPSGDQARHELASALGRRVSYRLRAIRPREVISRSTSAGATGLNEGAGADARYLLAGTLEPDAPGNSFAIRLLDGRTGRQVWRGRIARDRDGLHELEGAIASAVAARTLRDLTPEQQRRIARPATSSPRAYQLLLAGIQAQATAGRAGMRAAIEAFDAAWREDPAFIDAWVMLAMAYARYLDRGGFEEKDAEAMVAAGLAAADRALALDPGQSEAWVIRGMLLERRNPRSLGPVREAYQRALAVDPNNWLAHRQLGVLLGQTGEHERASAHLRSALFLEPEHARVLTDFAELRLSQQRFGEACALLNAAIEADRGAIDAYVLRAITRIPLREYRAAWADAETAARLGSPTQGEAVSVLVDLAAEDVARARTRARQLAQRPLVTSRNPLSVREGQLLAFAFVAAGERALAIRSLERVRPRGAALWHVMQDVRLASLRGDSGFQRLLDATSPFEDQP